MEIQEIKNKMTEVAAEYPLLLQYFKLHDRIRIHMINCEWCSKQQACTHAGMMRTGILGLHRELNEHFSLKERKNGV